MVSPAAVVGGDNTNNGEVALPALNMNNKSEIENPNSEIFPLCLIPN
jgi:hypothetical protein